LLLGLVRREREIEFLVRADGIIALRIWFGLVISYLDKFLNPEWDRYPGFELLGNVTEDSNKVLIRALSND